MKNLLRYLILLIVAAGCGDEVAENIPVETVGYDDSVIVDDVYSGLGNDTIYHFGEPIHSDAQLNAVGKSYGVIWKNLGCVDYGDYDYHNEQVKTKLNKKNGEGWLDDFWKDVEEKY